MVSEGGALQVFFCAGADGVNTLPQTALAAGFEGQCRVHGLGLPEKEIQGQMLSAEANMFH